MNKEHFQLDMKYNNQQFQVQYIQDMMNYIINIVLLQDHQIFMNHKKQHIKFQVKIGLNNMMCKKQLDSRSLRSQYRIVCNGNQQNLHNIQVNKFLHNVQVRNNSLFSMQYSQMRSILNKLNNDFNIIGKFYLNYLLHNRMDRLKHK